jgi:hypothetical protein
LQNLYKHLKSGEKEAVLDAIEYMDDMHITNEHFKEHLMGVCGDKKLVESFDKIDPKNKALFTRLFNQSHKDFKPTKTTGAKGKGKGKAAAPAEDEEEEEEEEMDAELLLEEEVLIERRKARLREKEEKQ